MGKTKAKSRKEVEHLRGVIRSLKKQLRSRQGNTEHQDEVKEDSSSCENCGKGTLMVKDFVHIKMLVCDVCDFREKIDGEEKP